jgi:hypothetical protein
MAHEKPLRVYPMPVQKVYIVFVDSQYKGGQLGYSAEGVKDEYARHWRIAKRRIEVEESGPQDDPAA